MLIEHVFKRVFRFSFVIYVLEFALLADKVTSLSCYICGPVSNFDCNYFNSINETLFRKECPEESKACGTETNVLGNVVVARSCEDVEVNDCKIANDVEYCYCSSDFCNGIKPIKTSINPDKQEITDDEDLVEGSGFATVTFTNTRFITTTVNTITALTPKDTLSSAHLSVDHRYILPTVFLLNSIKIKYFFEI